MRVGEGVYEFPESMRDHITLVHHYCYRVDNPDWERMRPLLRPQ